MGRINVCVSADDNYSRYAAVVIASVLANAKESDDLYFYVLDGGISEESKAKIFQLKSFRDCSINFVKIDNNLFKDYMEVKTHGYISLPTYYRMKAASLLPDVDKLIYLDCDIVVNASLEELFSADMDGFAIAGVRDTKKSNSKISPTYVNAGMLVLDLNLIREKNIEHEFLVWTKEHFDEIKTGDQQIINETLNGKIKLLHSKWNVQSSNFTNRSSYETRPNIIHYVSSQKPWKKGSWNYFKHYYRQYEKLTAWASDETVAEIRRDDLKGMINYLKYRPLFFLRPRFYKALLFTYVIRR